MGGTMEFNNSYEVYDKNAIIQEIVAENLVNLIKHDTNYNNVLELGCGTGIFTKKLINKIKYSCIDLNDIFDTREYFSKENYRKYLIGDMENLNLDSYSLVTSSSCLQWAKDLKGLLKKISQCTDNFIFSIYISGNLKEIKEHFNISLDYLSMKEIEKELSKLFLNVECGEEELKLEFDTPILALKHLKNTGVTGIGRAKISEVKTFNSKLLTYKVAYFKCSNNVFK